MGTQYNALVTRLKDIHNLNMASSMLSWDQQTQMPEGGAEARASQLATLSKLAHEMFTSDETGHLLEDARGEVGDDYDSDAASMVRVTTRGLRRKHQTPDRMGNRVHTFNLNGRWYLGQGASRCGLLTVPRHTGTHR